MKYYDYGTWGLGFIFTLDGSIFQKSFACAVPCSMLAFGLHWLLHRAHQSITVFTDLDDTTRSIIAGYTGMLGFLIVFRSQQAYSRWWEAATLLQQLRGQWFTAYSSAVSFCSDEVAKSKEVKAFQGELVRLMSLLHALSLGRVSTMSELEFHVIDLSSLDPEALIHLRQSNSKVEIAFQWVQRLIINNTRNGVLDVSPPILSRVYQELSRGFVILQDVEKFSEFAFPFPYCQLLSVLIMFQGLVTPIICAASVKSPFWAVIATFTLMFAYCGVNYIAAEIEMPCGDDRNDLPLKEMQIAFNRSIESLLHFRVRDAPVFHHTADEAVCFSRLSQKSQLDIILTDELSVQSDSRSVCSPTLVRSLTCKKLEPQRTPMTKKGFPRLFQAVADCTENLHNMTGQLERRSSWFKAQHNGACENLEKAEDASFATETRLDLDIEEELSHVTCQVIPDPLQSIPAEEQVTQLVSSLSPKASERP
eukprot:TRINITY_DN11999_c0_g3_i1.p1 TRINITY_DN11999_c0_g3~~TRINITY_DN11999_c0_g3_i1.p1  ORF type:complete len:507 (-),score=49.95 TRINITY_DN11999_c0_g3_i1:29-1462(-)